MTVVDCGLSVVVMGEQVPWNSDGTWICVCGVVAAVNGEAACPDGRQRVEGRGTRDGFRVMERRAPRKNKYLDCLLLLLSSTTALAPVTVA